MEIVTFSHFSDVSWVGVPFMMSLTTMRPLIRPPILYTTSCLKWGLIFEDAISLDYYYYSPHRKGVQLKE